MAFLSCAAQSSPGTHGISSETLRTLGSAHQPCKNFFGRYEAPFGNRTGPAPHAKNPLSYEPTLGLDPQTRNQLWSHVKRLNQEEQVTVFLTTHYMDEADRVAHRIAIIDHGKIVAQGTPEELKQQTATQSLEEAFLSLTGSTIRDEAANSNEQLKQMARMWGGNRR